MSTDAPAQRRKYPRPSVVTLSCVFIGVTAFLTLTDLITALMNWGTVEMQDALRPALRELHRGGLDPTMPELLAVLRWVGLAMVIFVVSTLVFSIFALRGDRSARIFTTVFAVGAGIVSLPLGMFGILQAAMLFLAAGALWSPAASRWWRDEPELAPSAGFPSERSPELGEAVPVAAPPAPDPSALEPPVGPPASRTVRAASRNERPSSVLTAGWVTILGSLAAAGFGLLYIGVYTFARPAYMDAVQTGPFKDMVTADEIELIMKVTLWVSIALLPLALTGLVGAAALLARRRIGRATTLVWAWVAGLMGLIMFPLGPLATAGAGTVIVLLLRDDARAWTRSPD
jgi:hypothetical protein